MSAKTRVRLARVRFRCFTYDPWPLLVAGSISELGNWDPGSALPMRLEAEVNGCREWIASIKCSLGESFKFKFAAQSGSGPCWEMGDNRICSPDDRWMEVTDAFAGKACSGSRLCLRSSWVCSERTADPGPLW